MAQQEGKHYRYMQTEFYAERGMITLIDLKRADDDKSDPFKTVQRLTPGEFMKRAIGARIAGTKYPSQERLLGRLLEDATAACKLAKIQGDPTDPAVIDHLMRHKRKSSILTPGEVNSRLGPVGGPRFRLQVPDQPRDALLSGVQVRPDLTIPQSAMLTPKRAEMLRRAARR